MPNSKHMERGWRPTLRDVAEVAGVSHITVSRVVRGKQIVRAETVKRVEAAIKKVGYKPDPTMSALAAFRMQGKQSARDVNLAFLDRDQSEYSGCVYQGLVEEAQLHGYSVEKHVLAHDSVQQKRLSRVLQSRGVRGLLFGPAEDQWHFTGWDWDAFAMVSLGAINHQPEMHSVCMNYFDSAYRACRLLVDQACQRIGFAVNPVFDNRTGHQWLGGYAAAMGGQNLYIYDQDISNHSTFIAWCEQQRLDGLLTIDPNFARVWPGNVENVYLLNTMDVTWEKDLRRCFSDPKQIGAEGMRVLHHLLLRRKYGLPLKPKMTALQGTWHEPNRAGSGQALEVENLK